MTQFSKFRLEFPYLENFQFLSETSSNEIDNHMKEDDDLHTVNHQYSLKVVHSKVKFTQNAVFFCHVITCNITKLKILHNSNQQ